MSFKIFDYIDVNGVNQIARWTKKLQKTQLIKLNEKLDKLANQGEEIYPDLLTDSGRPGILKLRVRGNVQLRPLIFRRQRLDGKGFDYILLVGAKEVNFRLTPENALDLAEERKAEIQADPERIIEHERIYKTAK